MFRSSAPHSYLLRRLWKQKSPESTDWFGSHGCTPQRVSLRVSLLAGGHGIASLGYDGATLKA